MGRLGVGPLRARVVRNGGGAKERLLLGFAVCWVEMAFLFVRSGDRLECIEVVLGWIDG